MPSKRNASRPPKGRTKKAKHVWENDASTAHPRCLTNFMDDVLAIEKESRDVISHRQTLLLIQAHLWSTYKVAIGTSTIDKRLTKKSQQQQYTLPVPSSDLSYQGPLSKYAAHLKAWESQGFGKSDMADMLGATIGLKIEPSFITKVLAGGDGVAMCDHTKVDWRDGKLKRKTHPLKKATAIPRQTAAWRSFHTEDLGDNTIAKAMPVDLLSDDEIQSMEDEIKAAYAKEAEPFRSHRRWLEILVEAMCCDFTIQKLVVKNRLQPDHHWSFDRSIDPLWILGLFLPGCYSNQDMDSREKIMEAINPLTVKTLTEVKRRLDDYLEEAISAATWEYGDSYLQDALDMIPATSPPQCLVELAQATRAEIVRLRRDVGLKKAVGRLHLPNFPACQALSQSLAEDGYESSLLYSFTKEVFTALEEWPESGQHLDPLPDLTDTMIQKVSVEDHHEDDVDSASEDGEAEDGSDDVQNESFMEEDGDDESVLLPKGTGEENPRGGEWGQEGKIRRLYAILNARVKMYISEPFVFRKWRGPTTGPLLGIAPSRFGARAWEPIFEPQAAEVSEPEIKSSFAMARRLSQSFRQSGPGAKSKSLEDSVKYLKNLVSSRSDAERAQYSESCTEMASCTSRPVCGSDIHRYGVWSQKVGADNWWHCRRLLQMLAKICMIPDGMYQMQERRLMAVLAAVRGGSTEVVLWLIALEGHLKEISDACKRELPGQPPISLKNFHVRQDLLRELSSFSHATAAINAVSRFIEDPPMPIAPYTLQKWYRLIYALEPRCAYSNCLRALPHPSTVATIVVRKKFSVAPYDLRRGSKRARSFISDNREHIYWCLYEWIRRRDPHPALVVVFVWYSGISHTDSSCKATRGKLQENF